jgi:hypothetical protein
MLLKQRFLISKMHEKDPVATAVRASGRTFESLALSLQFVRIWECGTFIDALVDQNPHVFEYSSL